METDYRECDFYKYCKECKYCDTPEVEQPCDDCLSNAFNLYSDKPVNFKEDDN